MGDGFTIIGFAIAAILFNISPGPSVIYVATEGASGGKLQATLAALGLATGSMFHAILAGIGVTAIIASDETASFLIAVLGGAFIIHFGLSGLKDSASGAASKSLHPSKVERSIQGPFWRGVAIEFLNPKTVIFYTSVLSGLLSVGEYTREEAILIALIVPATALPTDLVFGFAGGALSRKSGSRLSLVARKISSFIFIGFGLYMLMSSVISNPVGTHHSGEIFDNVFDFKIKQE